MYSKRGAKGGRPPRSPDRISENNTFYGNENESR